VSGPNILRDVHHYDTVPVMLHEKIVEKAKPARGSVKEEEEEVNGVGQECPIHTH
jgi:hypothetical protein